MQYAVLTALALTFTVAGCTRSEPQRFVNVRTGQVEDPLERNRRNRIRKCRASGGTEPSRRSCRRLGL